MSLSLVEESLDLPVPVYVIQGSEDMIAPPMLAEQFVAAADSPEKRLYQIHGSGHELLFEASDELLVALVERFGGD